MLINKLEKLKEKHKQADNGEEIKKVERQIHNFLLEDEIYWKQRSRADWLKEGDKNTKFFHSKASSRKRKNKIQGIENDQGKWVEDNKDIERQFCGYFTNIFSSLKPNQDQLEAALQGLNPKVTTAMNDVLEQPFTEEEITKALSQMCPTKAPGPDGLHAVFFQKYWQSVKMGVISICLHILNEKGIIAPLNHTYIALIPKIAKPRKVNDFLPISLCNVIYRIVTKTIANRLKHIIHHIISPAQSAFIPNRLITDNIIIGYECLHKIRHSKWERNGLVALKLDISKAYDRVEWQFLEKNNVEARFFKWLGEFNYGLQNYSIFFCPYQWCARFNSASKRTEKRVPSVSIFVHYVCRGFLQSTSTS